MCVVVKGREPVSVPLEDMAFLVLDNPQVSLSAALLAACTDRGCVVITTDSKHMPNGVLQSFHAYHRQTETATMQLHLSEPRKKSLWQSLIKSKIGNQAKCLDLLGLPDAAKKVRVLTQKVRSGDPDNVEGQAARMYWRHVNPAYGRDSEGGDRLNVLLNYGYALLRSSLAQTLAAYGFLPCMGIHHANQQNPFNLADDLIEPWRPIVDFPIITYWEQTQDKDVFDTKDRQKLLGLLFADVLWTDGEQQLLPAMRRYAEQLRPYYASEGTTFCCPTFSAKHKDRTDRAG